MRVSLGKATCAASKQGHDVKTAVPEPHAAPVAVCEHRLLAINGGSGPTYRDIDGVMMGATQLPAVMVLRNVMR